MTELEPCFCLEECWFGIIQEIMALGGIMGAAIMSLVTPERSALKYEPCPCLSNDCGRAGSTLGARRGLFDAGRLCCVVGILRFGGRGAG